VRDHAIGSPDAVLERARLARQDVAVRARGVVRAAARRSGAIWRAAITRRRSRWVWASVTFLGVEGAGLVVGRGRCPAGHLQAEWGDPVPFFELILPPRAAKAAVPILAVISAAALVAFVLRPPRDG
jgi:hypothetical protein